MWIILKIIKLIMSLETKTLKRTPADFFKQVFGRLVTVKL